MGVVGEQEVSVAPFPGMVAVGPCQRPLLCSAGSAVSLQPAGGFMPQLRDGEAGAGAEVVLGGWSTAPFPSLPSCLDVVIMDGRRAVAPLGPPPVPKQGLGCPGLGRDIFLGVSLSLHITDLKGERWGLPQAKPLFFFKAVTT